PRPDLPALHERGEVRPRRALRPRGGGQRRRLGHAERGGVLRGARPVGRGRTLGPAGGRSLRPAVRVVLLVRADRPRGRAGRRGGPAFRDHVDGKAPAHFVTLASMFRKALANPTADARLDRNAVEALLAPLDSSDRLWTLYFAGRFEDLRGHTKEATDYYRQC